MMTFPLVVVERLLNQWKVDSVERFRCKVLAEFIVFLCMCVESSPVFFSLF